MTYPIVGLMFGSKLSSTNLQTILDFPTPVSCSNITNVLQIVAMLIKHNVSIINELLYLEKPAII